MADGSRVTSVYDAAGQTTGVITGWSGAGLVRRLTYSYDLASRRLTQRAQDGIRTSWTYDPSGQLTAEGRNSGSGFNVTFTYDPAGNRLVQFDGTTRTTSTYDAANQLNLSKAGTARTTYQYDAAGNRSQKDEPAATTYYSWDAKNRMQVAEPVAGRVTFAYDGADKRVQKQSGATTTGYIWDFDKVLQETDGTGSTEQQYLSTDEQYGDLVSAYDGTDSRYYGFDALDSTEVLLDGSGSLADQYAYRAFGLATHTTGTDPNPYTFVGKPGYQQNSEIDLYFLRARYYDPDSGKFVSKDPIEFAAGDPNLYRYVANDPINGIDPSGLDELIVNADDSVYYQMRRGWYSPNGWINGRNADAIYLGKRELHDGELYLNSNGRLVPWKEVQDNVDSLWGNMRGSTWEKWIEKHKVDLNAKRCQQTLRAVSLNRLIEDTIAKYGKEAADLLKMMNEANYGIEKSYSGNLGSYRLRDRTIQIDVDYGIGGYYDRSLCDAVDSLMSALRAYKEKFEAQLKKDAANRAQALGEEPIANQDTDYKEAVEIYESQRKESHRFQGCIYLGLTVAGTWVILQIAGGAFPVAIGPLTAFLRSRGLKLIPKSGKIIDESTGREVCGMRALQELGEFAKAHPEAFRKGPKGGPLHHIDTNKNWVSTLRGGPWSPRFDKIFQKAGMTLEDAGNKVRVPGHAGPHPEQYHQAIFDHLISATNGLNGQAYKDRLLKELDAIANEAVTPGSALNKLLTK